MAISTSNMQSSSSSNYYHMHQQANIRASCYIVDARSTALQGFHYSSTGAGGIPSPPHSPPLAATYSANEKVTALRAGPLARQRGAAYTITGECERLFCETLRAVFLGEGNLAMQDSLGMGVRNINIRSKSDNKYGGGRSRYGVDEHATPSPPPRGTVMGPAGPSPAPDGFAEQRGLVDKWLEVWDYVGGARFRGFVAGEPGSDDRTMFVFFDEDGVLGRDLKPGLMALLELCNVPGIDCERIAVCLDRRADLGSRRALMHDLGWVGFEPVTLQPWTRGGEKAISEEWVLLGMEV
ncbi:ornithine decarboxylase antizyme-domain-containing protein [Lineolata rhizophorae]|uniref:Ornithine decarboxylase antizyme n=1 Tax=Lineolata rhizophorae TaxID=578093 RepID=A0A6A6P097_9PEZI|nr:ornithine decarboxylase antizyme-domain-containing protein [Lineolata rhizophorae]